MSSGQISNQILEEVASTWRAEGNETILTENGFDWQPGSHTVHVRILRNNNQQTDHERFRLSVETEYLRSVPVEDPNFVRLVGMSSLSLTSTYSLVYPPADVWKQYSDGESANMSMFSSVYVDQNTIGWLPRFFARMAILQPINAEIHAVNSPKLFGGGMPAFIDKKQRECCDTMLNVARDIYVPEGRKQCRWTGTREFVEFSEQYGQQDTCFGFGDSSGMTLETPFGADSALIRFMTDQFHPELGSGLLITTQIRAWTSLDDIRAEAAYLNFLESLSWTDFPQLGCWHAQAINESEGNLAHTCFVPNALYGPNIAINFAIWSIARVQWVRNTRFPNMENLTMAQILQGRIGLTGGSC